MKKVVIDIAPQNIFEFKNIFIKILMHSLEKIGKAFKNDDLQINEKTYYHSMEMGRDIPPNSPYSINNSISYSDENIFLTGRIDANFWNASEIAGTFLSFDLKTENDELNFYSGSENSESITKIILKYGDQDFIKQFFSTYLKFYM